VIEGAQARGNEHADEDVLEGIGQPDTQKEEAAFEAFADEGDRVGTAADL
jgi:hypothetical protein